MLKGSEELENITSINLDDIFSFMSASFIEVAGFGNKKLCKSNVSFLRHNSYEIKKLKSYKLSRTTNYVLFSNEFLIIACSF